MQDELREEEELLARQKRELMDQVERLKWLQRGQDDEAMRQLKSFMIESETELAVLLASRKMLEARMKEVEQKMVLVREHSQHQKELEGRYLALQKAHELEESGFDMHS